MKRYQVRYENDQVLCGSNEHTWGFASTFKSAKTLVSRCRKNDGHNPRNIKIFDTFVSDENGFAVCVYSEQPT